MYTLNTVTDKISYTVLLPWYVSCALQSSCIIQSDVPLMFGGLLAFTNYLYLLPYLVFTIYIILWLIASITNMCYWLDWYNAIKLTLSVAHSLKVVAKSICYNYRKWVINIIADVTNWYVTICIHFISLCTCNFTFIMENHQLRAPQ